MNKWLVIAINLSKLDFKLKYVPLTVKPRLAINLSKLDFKFIDFSL